MSTKLLIEVTTQYEIEINRQLGDENDSNLIRTWLEEFEQAAQLGSMAVFARDCEIKARLLEDDKQLSIGSKHVMLGCDMGEIL